MNCYHHFTIEERTCLRKYYMEGLSFRKIAKLLGRCAWQKGTNENLNGLLREFYPKGHNLSRVSPKTLKKNLALTNARPKKILNF